MGIDKFQFLKLNVSIVKLRSPLSLAIITRLLHQLVNAYFIVFCIFRFCKDELFCINWEYIGMRFLCNVMIKGGNFCNEHLF